MMKKQSILIKNAVFPLIFLAVTLQMGAQAPSGEIVRLDPALDKIVPKGAKVEKVVGGIRFAEGPLWVSQGGYLLFSDLPSNAVMKWTPGGSTEVYRKPVFTGAFPDGVQIGTNGLA